MEGKADWLVDLELFLAWNGGGKDTVEREGGEKNERQVWEGARSDSNSNAEWFNQHFQIY